MSKFVFNDLGTVWLVVEWKSTPNRHNGFSLVNGKDLINKMMPKDFHTGKVVIVQTVAGAKEACIAIVSNDKKFLETEIKHLQIQQVNSTANKLALRQAKVLRNVSTNQGSWNDGDQSDQDFTESASDWTPSFEGNSGPETGAKKKKTKRKKVKPRVKRENPKIKKARKSTASVVSSVVRLCTEEAYNDVMHNNEADIRQYPATSNFIQNQSIANNSQTIFDSGLELRYCQNMSFNEMESNISKSIIRSPKSQNGSDSGACLQMEGALSNEPVLRHSTVEPNLQHPVMENTYHIPPMLFDQQTQTILGSADVNISLLRENQKKIGIEMASFHKIFDTMKLQIKNLESAVAKLRKQKLKSDNVPNDSHPRTMEYVSRSSFATPVRNDSPTNILNCTPWSSDIVNDSIPRENSSVEIDIQDPQNNQTILNDMNETQSRENGSKFDPYEFDSTSPQKANGLTNSNQIIISNTKPMKDVTPTASASDMIPIGSGKTMISRHIYNQIKWSSYSSATRKLLMAVFPRRTLATHSLTGKSSPAFCDKPAKMKLDAKKITDIIMTVSQMSNIPESLIRNVITTKCADENKMYRIRKMKMQTKKANMENDENQEPDYQANTEHEEQ